MVVILSLVPTLRALDDERLAGKISCHRAMVEDPQNRSHTKKLWDGYEISLGPARNDGIDGNGCTAAMNLWPEETGHPQTARKQVKVGFAESIQKDYPDFAARLMSFSGVATGPARSSTQKIDWLKDLSANETFVAAKLSAAEQKQIVDQVENTSFDVPDSWETELRVRRVSLGESDGLIVRGTQLLCGGTGNCQTWVFRRSPGKWLNMFEREAPIVSGFGFEQEVSGGIKNFLVSANSSAAEESRTLFKFDGKVYRQSQCYKISIDDAAAEKIEKVSCK